MTWKAYEMKQPCTNLKHYLDISFWGTEENREKTSVRTAGIPAEFTVPK
jgi:hypothetical protein